MPANLNPEPDGVYPRICPACGNSFNADNPRRVYCSWDCKKGAQNQRHYRRRAKKIIRRVLRNRRKR